jgi:glycosyltransferase involved in cell wall biosynthesis
MQDIYISIIVPCYNTEKYIDDCLYSLTNQTINNIEIICIEDGSQDGTLEKLIKWEEKDTRIRIIRNEENKGIGFARNTGIKAAKADYVAFVDSDDFVSENKYKCLYDLSNSGSVDLIVSSKYNIHNEKEFTITRIPPHITEIESIRRHVLTHGFSIWNSIIKKNIFYKNDLFFPDRLLYEDAPVSTCLFLCARTIAVYYDEPLHYYRMNPSSITQRKGNLTYFDRLETAIMFYNNTKRLGFYYKYKDEIEYAFFYLFYKNTILYSLKKFNNNPPSKIIKTIPKRYKRVTSVDIKKNHYYRNNKPPFLLYAVAHYPELTKIWIPMFKIWKKVTK